MKQKNITLTTIALIITMAIALSLGLSMLHASAIGETPISNESFIPEKPDLPEKEQPNMHENLDEGLIDDNEVTPEGYEGETPKDETSKENIRDRYSGCITIDIYKHETAEYVGQVIIDSNETYETLHNLFKEYAENRTHAFTPNVDEVKKEHWLPKSEYRIEVMAGSIFAYSYGVENNNIMESLQSGMTFFGGEEGEKVINYINSFIDEKIFEIENGNSSLPNPKTSIVEIEKFTLYWNGGYHDILGTYLPANNRLTPRFPYIID